MSDPLGFIGLGSMGFPMASNLLNAGFPLRIYNRTADKARPLTEKGAALASAPHGTAHGGGVVISILADDRALEAVAGDALCKALGAGGVHISMSTVSPDICKRLTEQHARHGAAFVSAPVFGRPEAAAAGKLWICASGPAAAKQRVKPIFDLLGQGVFDFGEEPGAANVVKLAGNFLLTAAIEAMAEAAVLGEKHGIPRAMLLDMLTQTLFKCPIYTSYSRRLIDGDFDKVGFSAALALKDMTLARDAASAKSAALPILNVLCDRYLSAQARGRGKLDATVLARGVSDDAGLAW